MNGHPAVGDRCNRAPVVTRRLQTKQVTKPKYASASQTLGVFALDAEQKCVGSIEGEATRCSLESPVKQLV
mgnify:CR=1 FL=1